MIITAVRETLHIVLNGLDRTILKCRTDEVEKELMGYRLRNHF